jgi:hypothetical protein
MKSTVIAVLDYNCKVSEDEIHCARDAILGVKLAVGVHVECGLVRLDVALVNNGERRQLAAPRLGPCLAQRR